VSWLPSETTADVESWRMWKLGQPISPLEVIQSTAHPTVIGTLALLSKNRIKPSCPDDNCVLLKNFSGSTSSVALLAQVADSC